MRLNDKPYQIKWIMWGLLGLIILCGLMKATGGVGFVAILLPLLAAFRRTRTELLAYIILVTAILTVTNGLIAPKGVAFSIIARVIYITIAIVMILQNMGQKPAKMIMPLLMIFGYIGFQTMVSFQGWQPTISYLKLLLFTIVFLAFWEMSNAAASRNELCPQLLRSVVLSLACFLILGSIVLIPFPGVGKMGAAAALEMGLPVESIGLFQGVTVQPQTLGPLVSAIGVLLFADLLFSLKKWEALYLVLLLSVPVLIFYSSSRTAFGAWLSGMLFTTVTFVFANKVGGQWKNRAIGTLAMLIFIGSIMLLLIPQSREVIARFVIKYGAKDATVEVNWETVTLTRQGLMDEALENFKESPLIGNGFQVSKQMKGIAIQSWGQLLSAPVEKGVWVTAVLEEGGVIGMLLFLLFLVVSFWGLLRQRAFIGSAGLFVLVMSNFGEFSIFSLSGIGGAMWSLVFIGLALDAARMKEERQGWMYQRRVFPCAV